MASLGDRHRPGYRKDYERRRASLGLCMACPAKRLPGHIHCEGCLKKMRRHRAYTDDDRRIGRFSRFEEMLRLQQAERYALGRILKGEVVRRSVPGVAKLIERGLVEMRDRRCFPSLMARNTFKICECGRAIFHLVLKYHKAKCVL